MAYQTPKDVLNMFIAGLRGWVGEPLASCVFRKGPQRALRLSSTEECACIVALRELADGEQSAGSGNNWWLNWDIAVALLVKDDEDDPEGSEDTRLDLIEEFGLFMHANRTLFAGAKVGHMTQCQLIMGQYIADEDQIFRVAEIVVSYRTLRS